MIAAVVLAVSVLTGCSSTPTEKDAKAYVQAVLDMMCKGEYDHSVNIVDIEEGEEGNFREEAVDEAIDSMGIDFMAPLIDYLDCYVTLIVKDTVISGYFNFNLFLCKNRACK